MCYEVVLHYFSQIKEALQENVTYVDWYFIFLGPKLNLIRLDTKRLKTTFASGHSQFFRSRRYILGHCVHDHMRLVGFKYWSTKKSAAFQRTARCNQKVCLGVILIG